MSKNKITKNDLVDEVYKSNDFDRHTVQVVVDSLINELRKSMETGATIELRGFGTFEARLRKGRKGARNPKTGEKLTVEPHYVAAFRAGQTLKEKLWTLKKTDEK
ncbi:MAG: integration host factor subunit beta [Treponema sp.]|nr:integration host factor subunit beta [Treponema sp.]